jgi:hypothetical protein
MGVQIGCNRGSESRRNAGLWVKGRGFESFSLQRRVSREPDFLKRLPHPRVTEVRGKQPESVNQHQTGTPVLRGLPP